MPLTYSLIIPKFLSVCPTFPLNSRFRYPNAFPNLATLVVWYLIFNTSKTESLTFFSQKCSCQSPPSQLPVISFFQQLKSTYLEVSLPPHFLLHLITICQQISLFPLQNISRIQPFLTTSTTTALVQPIFSSHLLVRRVLLLLQPLTSIVYFQPTGQSNSIKTLEQFCSKHFKVSLTYSQGKGKSL